MRLLSQALKTSYLTQSFEQYICENNLQNCDMTVKTYLRNQQSFLSAIWNLKKLNVKHLYV